MLPTPNEALLARPFDVENSLGGAAAPLENIESRTLRVSAHLENSLGGAVAPVENIESRTLRVSRPTVRTAWEEPQPPVTTLTRGPLARAPSVRACVGGH